MTASISEKLDIASDLCNNNKFEQAEILYREVLGLDSTNNNALNGLILILKNTQRYDEASSYALKLIEIEHDATVYLNLWLHFIQKGDLINALKHVENIIIINSQLKNPEVFFLIAECFRIEKHFDKAAEFYLKAIALSPQNIKYYMVCAAVFDMIKKYDDAIKLLKNALSFDSENYLIHSELGNLYIQICDYDKAIEHCEKALVLKPDSAESYNNLAIGYKHKLNIEVAIKHVKKAIELNPDFVDAHYNLGTQNLLINNFDVGFAEYEWRLKKNSNRQPVIKTDKPMWDGGSLVNKTIFVCFEQGLGDSIMFARYLPLFVEKGARLLLNIPQSLENLFKRSFPEIEIVNFGEQGNLPDFDAYCFLMSLAYLFKTTPDSISFAKGYLMADKQKVAAYKEKHFKNNDFKIGIKWKGNPKGESQREIPLSAFLQLLDVPNVKLYSLQKGDGIEELQDVPKNVEIVDLGSTFVDFDDTAAAIENLDLVITCDTSIVHLAGALGKKTWLLLHSYPDWRWLLNEDKSNWYDSVTIFRCDDDNNWDNLLARVNKKLITSAIK